jgi:pimeloyl-ACP methyl ester carboxylesterase
MMNLPFAYLVELFGSLLSVSALLLIAFSIGRMTVLQRAAEERKKRFDTLVALSGERDLWQEFDNVRANLPSSRSDHADKDAGQLRLGAFLTRLEIIALGINQGIYDEEIAQRVLGDLMMRTFQVIRKELYEFRAAPDTPSYVEFEALVRRWESSERGDNFSKRRARASEL